MFAQVGDVITCTSRPDGGWWRGILRGREGVFPDNFVKVGIVEESFNAEETLTFGADRLVLQSSSSILGM